ncbi:hypothetical protein [Microscilla marina]|uniref:Uncharacterized protein n=1 Tax=Microscilla marina ATCC 23134 TaxID=313606 RepID=A1ZSG5_MICM2|nr:hypothetical protein [Microscilla marina]EAY26713.1 conserved hypothetical protein [Microscilla marina ATCC 23134]
MLTREQHLEFCKFCTKRKFDMNKGVICSLTNDIARFEVTCPDYENDPSVVAILDDDVTHTTQEIKERTPEETFELLKQEQNFLMGLLAGFGASLLGAALWATIVAFTGINFGLMALLVGAMVGFAVQKAGKGLGIKFGIAGAVLAAFGCFTGNILGIFAYMAYQLDTNLFSLLSKVPISFVLKIYFNEIGPISIILYIIAIVEGYKLAFRKVTDKTIHNLSHHHPHN